MVLRRHPRKSRLVLVVATVMILATSAGASNQTENSLDSGSWALQFRVTENFTLQSFEEGNFSVKRHFSAKSALRLGLGFNVSSQNDNNNSEAEYAGGGFELSAVYQRYINPESRANLYWGLGPLVDYSSSSSENRADANNWTKNESSNTLAGVLGVVGIEWFATREISLHAEYRGTTGYSRLWSKAERKTEGEEVQNSEKKRDRWFLGGGGTVLFGISVYF